MKAKVILVLLIAMSFSVVSQNATYSIPLNTQESIIREYQENVFIVYNSDGTDRTVNYVDLNAMVTISAQLPPVDIADFEIYDGFVYFCGTAYNVPIAGLFDIVGVFFGGGAIEYITLSNTLSCHKYISETDAVLSLRKIEVMPVDGGSPHLLMVGEASCTYFPDSVNRCIVDLYNDGSNWISAVAQAHDGIVYYDDLTVTDNYVVTVAHKHGAEGEFVLPYYRPTPLYDNIFAQTEAISPVVPSVPFHFQVQNHLSGGVGTYSPATDEEFLIEHISGDNFATVCHGTSTEYIGIYEGTVLNLYNSSFVVVNRYMIPEYSIKYPELKFNDLSKGLYLLPGKSSTCPNGYVEYLLDITTLSVLAANRYTDNTLSGFALSSLDAVFYSNGQSCLSGDPGCLLHIWRHLATNNKICSYRHKLTPFIINNNCGSYGVYYEYSIKKQPLFYYFPQVEIFAGEEMCKE